MSLVTRTLAVQRGILAAMLVGVALVFWRGAYSVFSLPKGTVVLVAAVGLLAWSGIRLARTGQAFVPAGPPLWAAGAFGGALVLATVTSPNALGSLAGQGGRLTGLVMYGAYLLVFAYAVRLYRHHSPVHLVQTLTVVAVPVVAYGYLQLFGRDPFGWGFAEHGPPMFSTLGNPNFFAAWIGIVGVLALAGALVRGMGPAWRVLCLIVGSSCAGAAAASQSLQGPAAFAAGGIVLAVVALWSADGALRRWRVHLSAAAVGLGVAAIGLVAAGVGPLAGVRDMALASYRSRAGKWEAAWAMFVDRPLLGQGLDRYAERYWTYRSVDEATARGILRNVDAAHSVPLDMFASGGLLLGLAYVAVLAVVAWSIVACLRRVHGDERVLLAGFAGAWVAYHVQSAVSIDVPALAVLGWLCAGVIVALGGTATLREVNLPGGSGHAVRPASLSWTAGIAVGTVLGVWLALWPFGVDLSAGAARDAARTARTEAATVDWELATRLAPWDARYPAELGHHLARVGPPDAALAAYAVAWDREQSLFRALTPARLAARHELTEEAALWFDRVLEVDGPKTTSILREAGEFRLASGDAEGAAEVYRHAVDLFPEQPAWWVALGQALAAAGDVDGARIAFERALELNPNADGAAEGLEALG